MNKISGSGCAAFAICLAFLQPAFAQVNAETDARAFIVREAEIRRQAAAAEKGQGQDTQKTTETAEAKADRKGRAKTARTSREGRTPLAAPAAFVPTAGAQELFEVNLLTNPGFELGGASPSGWAPFNAEWPRRDTSRAHQGGASGLLYTGGREREIWREERALPLNRPVYVLGYLGDLGGEPALMGHPLHKGRRFIISHRDERALGAATRRRAYSLYLASGLGLGASAALLTLALII